jgi:hypothetical protein
MRWEGTFNGRPIRLPGLHAEDWNFETGWTPRQIFFDADSAVSRAAPYAGPAAAIGGWTAAGDVAIALKTLI